MPTVSLNITTGIEYSPTDLVDSSVKLHNFIVGQDGSLYKFPVLKNIKSGFWDPVYLPLDPTANPAMFAHQMIDIKKFATFQTYSDVTIPPLAGSTPLYDLKADISYRRFVYLNSVSYGALNINYEGETLADESSLPNNLKSFQCEHYLHNPTTNPTRIDLNTFSNKILVDINAQYDSSGQPTNPAKAIFPSQHMFQALGSFSGLSNPRNMVTAPLTSTATVNDIDSLKINTSPLTNYNDNDLARGALIIGNRMIFYSAYHNALHISEPNNFSTLKIDENDQLYKIVPPEQIQSMTDFNGNIITFTPTGMERWVISTDETKILERDPTFHFDYRTRFNGSFVRANKDLYFYTDDLRAYRLNSNLTVDNIFQGQLPVSKPLDNFLITGDYIERDYACSHFKMLGQKFVSFGPWLYNIDTETWSTYHFDGFKRPTGSTEFDDKTWIWKDDTAKQTIACGFDDVICTYSAISRPMTYEEMQTISFPVDFATFNEGGYNYGEVAFFTSRMYQDERTFSLDGIEVYVRGGTLTPGVSKLYLQILSGAEKGGFDINDSSTWGQEATYQKLSASELGDSAESHVGKFVWRTNIKTDRFRVQVVTNEKRGIVVQSALANITQISDSQDYLVNRSNPQQQTQK
jgi:hypothetical protein